MFFYELEKFEGPQDAAKKSPANYSTSMNTHIFVQTALLYTSAEGERRIRVHNLAMPFSELVTDPYEHSDMSALSTLYLKKGIDNLETLNPNFLSTRSYIEM